MIIKEGDSAYIQLEETVQVHYETVFAALTTESGLVRWLPVAAEVDLREGGTIVFGWDEKLRRRTTVAILAFDHGGRITWDWFAGPADRHAPIEWTVTPDVEQGSQVTMRQGPFPLTVEGLLLLAGELESWRWHLCNLRSTFEAKLDMRRIRPL